MARYVKFFGLGGGVDGFITGSCNTVQATSYLQANGPQANINVAIIPKGTGAIVAACPDGTPTGGDARGQYAVDLQMLRGINTQIAGNQAVIVGGSSNTASGTQSVVVGGQNNIAGKLQSFIGGGNSNTIAGGLGENAIVGGTLNTNNGTYGFIGAGLLNTVSQSYGTISGGQSNTASTNTHATVVGGYLNTASGQYSVAGGQGNTASNTWTTSFGNNCIASGSRAVAMGDSTRATGNFSIAIGESVQAQGYGAVAIGGQSSNANGVRSASLGGFANNINGDYSLGQGTCLLAYLRGQIVFGASDSSNTFSGFEQHSQLLASRLATLSSAATTVLSLDGTGTTNLIIPYGNNRLWSAKITATAFVSAVSGTTLVLGDSYMAEYTVLFKRVGGTSSVVGTNAGNIISDTNMISSAFTFSAGASQELAITFKAPTTANADTFRCVAKVELVEVAY